MRIKLFLFSLLVLTLNTNAQVSSGSVVVNGQSRTFLTYVPSTWTTSANMPLLFVLHGTTQDGQGIMDISEFNTHAESNGFLVVYPDGIGGSWNTGISGASSANDIGLIDTLIAIHANQYGIDESRIFSCGFSAGGYMSYRLACESSRCFAGIASVGGTMTDLIVSNCSPSYTTPVLHIHGDADIIVAYNGGVIAGIGVDSVMTLWNSANNCPITPTISSRPNTNLLDLSTVDEWEYSPCNGNTSNVLLKINGGGHQWPGTNALLGGVGTINRDIDASEEIWNFFQGLDCATFTTEVTEQFGAESMVGYNSEHIQLENYSRQNQSFSVFDTNGRLVVSDRILPSASFSLRNLTVGIYLCHVENARPLKVQVVK